MVGQMGFQSHSYYLVFGSRFKWMLSAGDTIKLDWERAETNPSNQPNQLSVLGNWVKTEMPAMNTVVRKWPVVAELQRNEWLD